jgi:DNA invertase Pin-like site-specific DNA recombinase
VKPKTLGRIYGRFSSKPQERGDSKRRQIEGAKAYALNHQIEIISTPYFDEAVSGKDGANLELEFGRLLKDVKAGEAVLCEALDRIGRQNPFLIGKLVYDLVVKGVTVIAWQEEKIITQENINDLSTQFSLFTGAAIGHADNLRKIKRVQESITNALKQAEQGTPNATLIKYLPECFKWDGTIILYDKCKADLIRRIFNMYNSGMGKPTICQTLFKEGIPTLYPHSRKTIGLVMV